jgi:hypothetical protein
MQRDCIAEVGIDGERRLFVRPGKAKFPHIYREAMDVHWDASRGVLHSPAPRDWSYIRWFQQIIAAAAEQSYDLRLAHSTLWSNVSSDIRAEIEQLNASREYHAKA